MLHSRPKIFAVLFFIFYIGTARAEVGNKILVISSYGSDYQWSNSIVDAIKIDLVSDFPNIELNIEYLSAERFVEPIVWVERIDMLLNNYQEEMPAAIILISDEAWMSYRAADNARFKSVPVFLCAVKPHSITIDKYITNHSSLALADFTPTEEAMKPYNATAVIREINVEGYVSLMEAMIPNIDRYTIITDSRFYGVYTRLLFDEYLKQSNSQRLVEYLDARFITTDTLLNKLDEITATTGVLLTSWLTGRAGFEYSKQYIYKEMSSRLKTPIFITNDIGIESGYFLGGYYYSSQFWGKKMGAMIVNVLNGVSPGDIMSEEYKTNTCQINWEVMEKFNISPQKMPEDTIYINLPESMFIKYFRQFIVAAIALMIILLSYGYVLRNNIKLKRTQKLAEQAVQKAYIANKNLIETQDNLKAALIKAEAADRLKSIFISNMGHEIRTPLNSIVGFSSLISSMEDKEDIEEAATQIAENSDKLLQIVKGILDLSQLEAGTAKFDYGKLNMNGLFHDLTNVSARKCKPDVTIQFVPPELPFSMITEPNMITQVLSNLMDNAIKFTLKGEIELGYFKYDENWVEFYVQDTGIGMNKDEIDRIFERFYKSDTHIYGTGLGLSIAKQIIEALGGQYGVTSEQGVGSRFWFRIQNI